MAAERRSAATQADLDSFYNETMTSYCASGRGAILQLPQGSKFGDFAGYTKLHWSRAQQIAWRAIEQAPIRLKSISPQDTVMTITFHATIAQTPGGIPKISPADYRRLQEASHATTSLWQMANGGVMMVPKAAIQFTDAQKQAYQDGTIKEDGSNAPDMASCFDPLFLSSGPNGYAYDQIWISIAEILKEEKNRSTAKNLQERRGLNVLLPVNNSIGDLVYNGDHIWTDDEVKAWKDNKIPPFTFDDLPGDAKILIHLVHFSPAQTIDEVRVSPDDFKKMDQVNGQFVSTLVVNGNVKLVIRSDEFEFTEKQKADFREGKIKADLSNAPFLCECVTKK